MKRIIDEILETQRIRLSTYPYFMNNYAYRLSLSWSVGRNGRNVLETYHFEITKENNDLNLLCTSTGTSCSLKNNKKLAPQLRLITASMNISRFPLDNFLSNIFDALERSLASEIRLQPDQKFVVKSMKGLFSKAELYEVAHRCGLGKDSIEGSRIENQIIFVVTHFVRRPKETGLFYLMLKRAKPSLQWMDFVTTTSQLPDRNTLANYMHQAFDISELEYECFALGIEVENLSGRDKRKKLVSAIIKFMVKHGRYVELAVHIRRLRSEAP